MKCLDAWTSANPAGGSSAWEGGGEGRTVSEVNDVRQGRQALNEATPGREGKKNAHSTCSHRQGELLAKGTAKPARRSYEWKRERRNQTTQGSGPSEPAILPSADPLESSGQSTIVHPTRERRGRLSQEQAGY